MTKPKDGSEEGPKVKTKRSGANTSPTKLNLNNLPQWRTGEQKFSNDNEEIKNSRDSANISPTKLNIDDLTKGQIRGQESSVDGVAKESAEPSYVEQMEPEHREKLFEAYVSELDLSKKKEANLRKQVYPDGEEMNAGEFDKVYAQESDEVKERIYDVAFEGATSKREIKAQKKKAREDKKRLAARDKLYDEITESVPARLRKSVGLYIQGTTSDDPEVRRKSREWFLEENGARNFDAQERAMIENYMGLVLGVERANAEAAGDMELAGRIDSKAERLGGEAHERYIGGYNGFMSEMGIEPETAESQEDTQEDVQEDTSVEPEIVNAPEEKEQLLGDEAFVHEEYDPNDEFNWRDAEDLDDVNAMSAMLATDTWANQRKYYSETVEEAETRVRDIAKKLGMPELDIKRSEGVDTDTAKMILDTISETLEQTEPEYLSNFYRIEILPPVNNTEKIKDADGKTKTVAVKPLTDEQLDEAIKSDGAQRQLNRLKKEAITARRISDMHETVQKQVEQEVAQRIIQKAARNQAEKALRELYAKRGFSEEEAQKSLEADIASGRVQNLIARAEARLTDMTKSGEHKHFNSLVDGVMESGNLQKEIANRQRAVEDKWNKQLEDQVKGLLQTVHMYDSASAMAVTPTFKPKHDDYPVEIGLRVKTFPGLSSDFYKNLMTHEMGHVKSFIWADTLLTNLTDIDSGGDYTADYRGKNRAFVIRENKAKEKAMIQSISSLEDFQAFMDDWGEVSMYKKGEIEAPLYRGNTNIGTKKVSTWQLKDDVPKANVKQIQDYAFGKQYASEHHEDFALGRNSMAEEVAEAYKMYKHPKRNSYLKYLHKSGRREAARYLENLMRVIDKYEKKTQSGDVPSAIANERQTRLAKEQVDTEKKLTKQEKSLARKIKKKKQEKK